MDDVVTDLGHYQAALNAMQASAVAAAPAERVEETFMESYFSEFGEPKPAADEGAGTAPRPQADAKPVPTKSILCVEAQTEIQDALRKQISAMGYRVMLVSDAERGAEMYHDSPVDAVLFDTDGQGSESIEAFIDMHETAHEEGRELIALVLLGPRQDKLREKLPADDRLIVLNKPIKMKQVQDALHQLLPLK
jgi:CheY-like chemotaxis protein